MNRVSRGLSRGPMPKMPEITVRARREHLLLVNRTGAAAAPVRLTENGVEAGRRLGLEGRKT